MELTGIKIDFTSGIVLEHITRVLFIGILTTRFKPASMVKTASGRLLCGYALVVSSRLKMKGSKIIFKNQNSDRK